MRAEAEKDESNTAAVKERQRDEAAAILYGRRRAPAATGVGAQP